MELQRQWSSFLPNLRVAAPNPAETLSAGEEPAANYERQARQFSRDRLGRRSSRLDQCRFWALSGLRLDIFPYPRSAGRAYRAA
jgi:hypothetical protein